MASGFLCTHPVLPWPIITCADDAERQTESELKNERENERNGIICILSGKSWNWPVDLKSFCWYECMCACVVESYLRSCVPLLQKDNNKLHCIFFLWNWRSLYFWIILIHSSNICFKSIYFKRQIKCTMFSFYKIEGFVFLD